MVNTIMISWIYVYLSTMVTSLNWVGSFLNCINLYVIQDTRSARRTTEILLMFQTRIKLVTISINVTISANSRVNEGNETIALISEDL